MIRDNKGLTVEPRICPLCGDVPYALVGRGLDYILRVTSLEFECRRCLNCGMIFPNLQPVPSQLSDFYRDDFINDKSQPVYNAAFKRQMKFRAGRLLNHLDLLARRNPRFKLLDIGSGRGDLFVVLKERYPQAHLHSVDLTTQMLLPDVTHHMGYFENMDFNGKSFDVITSQHNIEHVYDPVSYLEKAASLLDPEGFIFIATPNTDALEFKIGRKRLYCGGYYPPRHLSLFSEKTFRVMVSRFPDLDIAYLGYFFTIYHWVGLVHHFLFDHTRNPAVDRIVNYNNLLVSLPWYLFDLLRYKAGFKTGVLEIIIRKKK